jgi:hypothetical protein
MRLRLEIKVSADQLAVTAQPFDYAAIRIQKIHQSETDNEARLLPHSGL